MDPESDEHQGSSLVFFVESHPKVKSGIVDCLYHKAEWICKQDSTMADERKHVQKCSDCKCSPREWMSHDQKCYVRRSKP